MFGQKKTIREVAVLAAQKAGALLMENYGKLTSSQIHMKSKNDFVTELDRASEACIIAEIKKNFPDHAIQAEESGKSADVSQTLWVIDPLDGTSNYIHCYPMFAVSIGVRRENEGICGVIFDPTHDEMFITEKGKGATVNGKPMRVADTPALKDALMVTGIPFRARNRFDQYMQSFYKISMASAGMRRSGSAALDLAYVAAGRLDGFWELDLSPWDVAAGSLMVREAGGAVTDVRRGNDYMSCGDIVASNGKIHEEICTITSGIF